MKIDNGREFDWGRISEDYAAYRDIYPAEFYQKLLDMGLCIQGQQVLDIGTGTGVLPRGLYQHGASFTGIDRSEAQIKQALRLTQELGMEIEYHCVPAEQADFPADSFDVVTACQCFDYFDHKRLAPRLASLLKPGGRFAVLYMEWLPFEDKVAGESERLILNFNPMWTGGGEHRHPIAIPEEYDEYFTLEQQKLFDLSVPFTRESWNGRIKACRGVGASLPPKELEEFDVQHRQLLQEIAPQAFEVLHYAAMAVMKKR